MSQFFTSGGQSIDFFSFSISPSNEYLGLISFSMDWFDLLAVQGTLKSLFQHHRSKASIRCSAFFIVQLSHPYMTTGKPRAFTIWTFVGKVILLFNILSRFVTAFLPRSKRLLISWVQSPLAVILEPKNIKSVTASLARPTLTTPMLRTESPGSAALAECCPTEVATGVQSRGSGRPPGGRQVHWSDCFRHNRPASA